MGLLERINAVRQPVRDNTTSLISMQQWQQMWRPGSQVNYNGNLLQAFQISPSATVNAGLYEGDGIVFSCESKRLMIFSEARFQFQRLQSGRPGDLFGSQELSVLEEPWPGASTRDLLMTAEFDVATCGNSYWVKDEAGYLLRLDPGNVKILTEAVEDPITGGRIGERLLGYAYMSDSKQMPVFSPREIAHYKPLASRWQFIGQSWMSAVLPDVDADMQMTEHKRVTLRTGANHKYVVSLDRTISAENVKKFAEQYHALYDGAENSGKTLFLGGGADIKTITQSFADLSLAATQAATETRIAAASGIHPAVLGLSEGMSGSSLNAGNYTAAKRNTVDSTMRPLWGAFAGAFQWLLSVPNGARLWYDDRDIAFLREDVKDLAEIQNKDASTINTLIMAGFDPDAVIDAVQAQDLKRLAGKHSGLFSVQLQPAGAQVPQIPQREVQK
jgi:hypothetical protein